MFSEADAEVGWEEWLEEKYIEAAEMFLEEIPDGELEEAATEWWEEKIQ